MAERYLDLAPGDRQEVLDVAASASGRPAYLLEKDIWVVWALETLFKGSLGEPPVCKDGTCGRATLAGVTAYPARVCAGSNPGME